MGACSDPVCLYGRNTMLPSAQCSVALLTGPKGAERCFQLLMRRGGELVASLKWNSIGHLFA